MMNFNTPDLGDRPVRWRDPNALAVPEYELPPRRVPLPFAEDPASDIGRFNVALLRTLAEALVSNGMWVRFKDYGPYGSEGEAAGAKVAVHSAADALGLKIATLRQGWMIPVRSALELRLTSNDSSQEA